MARTVSQADRLQAERSLQLYEDPNLVERQFRLQATDFAEMPPTGRTLRVRTVGTQGIERLAPVLHFEGLTKPLVLDDQDITAMARLTGSPLWGDWVGQLVPLHIAYEQAGRRVRIGSPTASQMAAVLADPERLAKARKVLWKQIRLVLLLLFLIALAILTVYLIENSATLIAGLRQFLTDQKLIR